VKRKKRKKRKKREKENALGVFQKGKTVGYRPTVDTCFRPITGTLPD
jgi:hypothetical protein